MATRQQRRPIEVTLDTRQQVALKNRDLIDFQKITGKTMASAMKQIERDPEDLDWTVVTALLWIMGRKSNPAFSYEDALDADVNEETMKALLGMIADPTAPASAGAS